jgi:hypothetical protein
LSIVLDILNIHNASEMPPFPSSGVKRDGIIHSYLGPGESATLDHWVPVYLKYIPGCNRPAIIISNTN